MFAVLLPEYAKWHVRSGVTGARSSLFPFLLPPWRAPGITPLRSGGIGPDSLKRFVGRPRAGIIRQMGIRDFIRQLEEHRERLQRGSDLSITEREETLREAEIMVGMAEAAIKELDSIIRNRRINLPEEHAVRFAQDVFLYLRDEEEKVKEHLRKLAS